MNWKYLLKRIGYLFFTYVVIVFIYSALFNTVMENTLRSQLSEQVKGELLMKSQKSRLTVEESEKYRQERLKELYTRYHLDDPVISRIFWRAYNTLKFDWGNAITMKASNGSKNVFTIVKEAIPNTVLLFTTATIFNTLIGVILGLKKAQKPGKILDQSTSIFTMIIYGMPNWWLAMILIMALVYTIPLFPSSGIHSVPPPEGIMYYVDMLHHLALPLLTLMVMGFWGTGFITRNIVLGTLQEDFVMSSRARGLPESRVLFGHTLRTAAPPIATFTILGLLGSLGGSLVFEGIFSWPGMGNLYWIAVQSNDMPVLMGNLAVTTMLYLGGLFILDILYGFLDPRIKAGGK